jgi:cyclophilin family peptidyl-prolyl cis-trans isomerase
MANVVLEGKNLTEENVKKEIIHRATKKKQGADAIITREPDGAVCQFTLMIDNNQILFNANGSRRTFMCDKYRRVEFI